MENSLTTAFLGGVFANLGPRGAVLTAFFASVIGRRLRLMLHGESFLNVVVGNMYWTTNEPVWAIRRTRNHTGSQVTAQDQKMKCGS